MLKPLELNCCAPLVSILARALGALAPLSSSSRMTEPAVLQSTSTSEGGIWCGAVG